MLAVPNYRELILLTRAVDEMDAYPEKKIRVFVAPARKDGSLAPKVIGIIFVFYLASWRVKRGRFESEERAQPHTA